MNEERTRKCLQQMEHIRGHLWHRYIRHYDSVRLEQSEIILKIKIGENSHCRIIRIKRFFAGVHACVNCTDVLTNFI
jgi:hypothetical protein